MEKFIQALNKVGLGLKSFIVFIFLTVLIITANLNNSEVSLVTLIPISILLSYLIGIIAHKSRSNSSVPTRELRKLSKMYKKGLLSQSEYEAEKAKILNK